MRLSTKSSTFGCVCSVTKLCLTLGGPVDCSPPGSTVHGISKARILEWVAISCSRDLPNPGIKPTSPAFTVVFFTTEPPRKPLDIWKFYLN